MDVKRKKKEVLLIRLNFFSKLKSIQMTSDEMKLR